MKIRSLFITLKGSYWIPAFLYLLLTGCASERAPVPPGVVPEQQLVASADEQYGHEVLGMLVQQYPLDQDDARIQRVRGIVDQLTRAIPGTGDQWHVYVMRDDTVKNAAATRGNYIFVWTGMLRQVQSDDELAAILAHEIGHVLAGHTQASPAEEVNEIVSGIAGTVAREVVAAQGAWGLASDLAEILAKEAISAFLINPESQRNELEADQIGLFLMADAGYDPEDAVQFWERVKSDPGFSGFPLQFLSSHPSSEERLIGLKENLPPAKERYLKMANPNAPGIDKRSEWIVSPAKPASQTNTPKSDRSATTKVEVSKKPKPAPQAVVPSIQGDKIEIWLVIDSHTSVFEHPEKSSKLLQVLEPPTEVQVVEKLTLSNRERWLRIQKPIAGYVVSFALAPKP